MEARAPRKIRMVCGTSEIKVKKKSPTQFLVDINGHALQKKDNTEFVLDCFVVMCKDHIVNKKTQQRLVIKRKYLHRSMPIDLRNVSGNGFLNRSHITSDVCNNLSCLCKGKKTE